MQEKKRLEKYKFYENYNKMSNFSLHRNMSFSLTKC